MKNLLSRAVSVLALVSVAGCANTVHHYNVERSGDKDHTVTRNAAYQAQYRDIDTPRDNRFLRAAEMNAVPCLPLRGGDGGKGIALPVLLGEKLTRNDLLDVRIGADEQLSGSYVVSRDGTLKVPFMPAIQAQGRSPSQVEEDLGRALEQTGLYDEAPSISVRVSDFASVLVGVSGAVFEPHQVEIGQPSATIDNNRAQSLGASTEGRNLSAALRSAGGIRPDADISAVELRRDGKLYKVDMRGVFEGRNMVDVMLLTGDQIFVPSRQCFQDFLMKPSPISPPGVSLYLSNLTQPAAGNALSAIGRDVREIPYGTRHMQAVVDTNCVGGARASNAHRSAILLSRNPVTGVSIVIERDIEDMLIRADRDDYDPYMLPGDAIACYDSTVTNIGEVGRVLGLVAVGALVN